MTGSHRDLAEVIRDAADKTRLAELGSSAAESRLNQHENQSRRADALEDAFAKRVAERVPPAGKEDIAAFMKAMKEECPGHSASASQGLKAAAEVYAGDSAKEPQFRQAAQRFRDSAAERLSREQSLQLKVDSRRPRL